MIYFGGYLRPFRRNFRVQIAIGSGLRFVNLLPIGSQRIVRLQSVPLQNRWHPEWQDHSSASIKSGSLT